MKMSYINWQAIQRILLLVCMKKRPKNMRDNFNDSLGKAIIIILKRLHYWIKGQMEMGKFTLNRTMKEYIKVFIHIIGTTTTNILSYIIHYEKNKGFHGVD